MPIAPGVMSFDTISRYFSRSDNASSIIIERRFAAQSVGSHATPPLVSRHWLVARPQNSHRES
jgi:hypothetical protein